MTASDDFRSERPGPVDDRPAGSASGAVPSATPSRSDFPVRRGATAGRGPVSRDEGLVGGRARFRSDRHRTWNARRDLLPGGRQVRVVPGDGPDDEPPPLPDDLRVDRLEVVRDDAPPASRSGSGQGRPVQPAADRYPLPQARTGWPAAPLPPTVSMTRGAEPGQHTGAHAGQPTGQPMGQYADQQPGRPADAYGAEPYSAAPYSTAPYPAAPYPAGAPAARPMPPSVARADGSITRADLADLLPRQATPQPAPQPNPQPAPLAGQQAGQLPFPQPGPQVAAEPAGMPPQGRPSGRRAASPRAGVPAPGASTSRPEGSTGAGPLDDLVPHPERVPYGVDLPTSADELFPPSTRQAPPDLLRRKPAGTSTGLQPRIFAPGTGTDESALPVLVGDPVAVGERPPADQVDGVRRFDLTGRAAPPVRPDPRLPVRPAPPADLDVVRAWGTAPQPAGAVGPSTGPLAAVTMPAGARTAAPAARSVPPVPPTRMPPGAPSSSADVSDLATLFGPRPGEEPGGYPAQGPVRVGHARRPAVEQPARRGWVVPTITAALGLVAGIVFATSSEPAAAPAPARTVIRTVTVAPTP